VSATAREVRAQRALPAWMLGAAGLGLLASRAVAHPSRAVLVLMFGAIGVASVARPVSRDRARMRPVVVTAIGIGAVWLAGTMTGAAPPAATGPLLAAVALNTLAAVAEEAFFRRFLYDRALRLGAAVAVCITALLFAAVHVPLYGPSVFWVDLGAGLLFGWQRWASGTWLAPAATHAAANLLVILR